MTSADLSPSERRRLVRLMDAEERHKKNHPLAYAQCWKRRRPRTSQLRNVQAHLVSMALYRFELGGNRSGKSEEGSMLDVCYALGADHPGVVLWARHNGIKLSETDIPNGPGVVWSVAGDSGDSKRYVRPKVEQFLPAGGKWRNRHGDGEATWTYIDARGKAEIVFKTVEQGSDGFQGDAVRRVRFDEEPRDRAVVSEASMRIVDEQGHLAFTMTPLNGWTALLEEYIRDPDDDTIVTWLHGLDNPHIDPDFLRRVIRKKGPHEAAARLRGEVVALEGRIYVDWQRHLHVVKSFPIPGHWHRFAFVDFGTRNPTAVGWAALDPRDDVVHVYREHYEAMRTQEWHVSRFKTLSGITDEDEIGEDISFVIADPAGTAERMTWGSHGVITIPAYKGSGSVRAGISAVANRLAPDANGKPHLVVHDCCPMFVREVESYVWDTRKSQGDLPDQPLKKGDHLMDGVRYLVHHLDRLGDLYRGDEDP